MGDGGEASRPCSTSSCIEKAAYEICYEAANRPAWIGVPLHGLARIAARIVASAKERPMDDDLSLAPALQAVIEGRSLDPFAVLGRHGTASGAVMRAMLPGAFAVTAVARDEPSLRATLSPCATAASSSARAPATGPYLLRIDWGGPIQETEDPYSFGPLLGDLDIYLLAEGKHRDLAQCLGAHAMIGRRRAGRSFCGLGAECAARLGGRRFQHLGWTPPPDAAAPWRRGVGDVRAAARSGRALQIRTARPGRRGCCR